MKGVLTDRGHNPKKFYEADGRTFKRKEAMKALKNAGVWKELDVIRKSDDSPQSAADRDANSIIETGLKPFGYPIVSEETKADKWETRKDYDYCWVVDPLDGSADFLQGSDEFTVNIALVDCRTNLPILGVVSVPAWEGCPIYYATQDNGAYKLVENRTTKLTGVREGFADDDTVIFACSNNHVSSKQEEFQKEYLKNDLYEWKEIVQRKMGSSVKFLLLAEGEVDVYCRLGNTCEWDTAAAVIIVRESGGEVYQYGTKSIVNGRDEDRTMPEPTHNHPQLFHKAPSTELMKAQNKLKDMPLELYNTAFYALRGGMRQLEEPHVGYERRRLSEVLARFEMQFQADNVMD